MDNRNRDLPDPGGTWERIGDVAEPGGPVVDFSAGDSAGSAHGDDKKPESLDALKDRLATLIVARDGVDYFAAASRVPVTREGVVKMLRQLQADAKEPADTDGKRVVAAERRGQKTGEPFNVAARRIK